MKRNVNFLKIIIIILNIDDQMFVIDKQRPIILVADTYRQQKFYIHRPKFWSSITLIDVVYTYPMRIRVKVSGHHAKKPWQARNLVNNLYKVLPSMVSFSDKKIK